MGDTTMSFAKTPPGHNSRPVTMLQSCPLIIHLKNASWILDR
jgi:hypothetical protein